jgi:hypothetical protein
MKTKYIVANIALAWLAIAILFAGCSDAGSGQDQPALSAGTHWKVVQ